MDFIKGIFSSKVAEKAVDGIYNGIDKAFYTPEEEAIAKQKQLDTKLKLLPLFAPFKLAQRVLAFWYSFLFGISFILGLGMILFNAIYKFVELKNGVVLSDIVQLDIKPLMSIVNGFSIGYIAIAIITWYFTGGIISSSKEGKKND